MNQLSATYQISASIAPKVSIREFRHVQTTFLHLRQLFYRKLRLLSSSNPIVRVDVLSDQCPKFGLACNGTPRGLLDSRWKTARFLSPKRRTYGVVLLVPYDLMERTLFQKDMSKAFAHVPFLNFFNRTTYVRNFAEN